jgi:hypothetical protein
VASKGVAGYGTWKKIRKMGGKKRRVRAGMEGERKILGLKDVTRQFS